MRKLFLTSMAVAVCGWAATVQARTIHGTVVEAGTNEPLIGATVLPIGGGEGVACDYDGNFTLNVPDNVKEATFSYVGLVPRTVKLTDGMKVVLSQDAKMLDDVVVVAYGTATRESLTGAVSVVGSKDIEDRPITAATQAIEGNSPGVQVNSSVGSPGSQPSILIRGFGTITGSTQPFYVVDQVPFYGDVADINPADIESITVLKDAASCALYGVNGGNGVVLITTKKAKKAGSVDVTLSIREGMYTRGLPEYDKMNASEWMESAFLSKANQLMYDTPGMYPDRATANRFLQQNFVSEYLKGRNIFNLPGDQLFNENGQILGSVLPGYTDLNWWDAVGRTGMRQEYNLNVAGATEKFNVFASLGYLNEKGYVLSTDFERYNARFNMNFQPTSYLKMGMNLNGSMQESEQDPSAGSSYESNPFKVLTYAPIYSYYTHDAEGNIIYENGKPVWNLTGVNDNSNIGYELRNNFTKYDIQILDLNAYATAVIPYGFELTFRGNMNRTAYNVKQYMNPAVGSGAAANGSFTETSNFNHYYSFQQLLNWSHDYGTDAHIHHVDALLVHENNSCTETFNAIYMQDQNTPYEYVVGSFNSISTNPTGSNGYDRTESYLARGRYNYNERYFAEFNIRRDGTARLHPNHRWGTFWSAGASWVISKESFMQNVDWLNYLKLRAAYGKVGMATAVPIAGPYSLYSRGAPMSNVTMSIRTSLGNPDLGWEGSETFDVAVEGAMFNNRLNVNIGFFRKNSSGLIFLVPWAGSLGYQIGNGLQSSMTMPMNIGSVSNTGVEIGINGTLMQRRDFKWTASIDATFYKNRVTGLPYGGRDMANGSYRLSEGRSMYDWYVPTFAGVDQMTGKPLYVLDYDEYAYQYQDSFSTVAPEGGISQMETNWNANIEGARDAGQLVEIGGKLYTTSTSYATRAWHSSAIPTVYGSFGTNLTWKGINLGLLFTYSLGGKTMDAYYMRLMTGSNLQYAFHKDLANSWKGIPEGMTADSPNRIDPNGIPVQNASLENEIQAISSRWLTSSSYLVLKNIILSYDLPQKWVRAIQLQNVNLGVSIDNLFTVTARKGLNPQQSMAGGQNEYGTFGTARVFSFQLTARF